MFRGGKSLLNLQLLAKLGKDRAGELENVVEDKVFNCHYDELLLNWGWWEWAKDINPSHCANTHGISMAIRFKAGKWGKSAIL
ncbi:hypothetical protein AKJ16_DCAP12995 [Drosera capensis]